MGLLAIVTGNSVPKLRPLGGRSGAARLTGAERRAGWTLVVTGIVLAGLFAFAPIELARGLAPVVALGGVGLIELDWIWAAWTARSRSGESSGSRTPVSPGQRAIAVWLLVGIAYVLVTASLKYITDDSPRVRDLGAWAVIGFSVTFSLLYALPDLRRRGAGSPRGPIR
jgi:hypothetical protein